MAGLVPFNRNKSNLATTGNEDFFDMLNNFFENPWLPARNLMNDTFKLDVQDNDKEYLIEAELPGVKKEEVSLELNDNRLSISIEKEENINEEKKNYIHKERRTTSMQRYIYLQDAQADGIKAKLDNGVLSIQVPKISKKQTKSKIDVE
jgi:HSP20 family protein